MPHGAKAKTLHRKKTRKGSAQFAHRDMHAGSLPPKRLHGRATPGPQALCGQVSVSGVSVSLLGQPSFDVLFLRDDCFALPFENVRPRLH